MVEKPYRCKYGCGQSFISETIREVHETKNCPKRKGKVEKHKSKRVMKNWKPRGKSKRKKGDDK